MRLTGHKVHFLFVPFFILLLAMISSCSFLNKTTVKSYPLNKPFVYENKIILKGNIAKDEKIRLTEDLNNYWDDSLKVRKIQQFFGIKEKLKNPPVYDSINISRTIIAMNAYLNSQGYYYATFDDSVRVDTVNDQLRAKLSMSINVGKNISIDSLSFDMGDTTLQKLTKEAEPNTLLKKGTPYTKQVINSELDRLVSIYRQNGYYYFTREDFKNALITNNPNTISIAMNLYEGDVKNYNELKGYIFNVNNSRDIPKK